jgi:hypothetical protein
MYVFVSVAPLASVLSFIFRGLVVVLQERIELSTSPLPRVCSTTELLQHLVRKFAVWRLIRR